MTTLKKSEYEDLLARQAARILGKKGGNETKKRNPKQYSEMGKKSAKKRKENKNV
jgi:hypothetical protein